MLVIQNKEYMEDVLSFAKDAGAKASKNLEDKLTYLGTYAYGNKGEGNTRCHIGQDFAANSFAFCVEAKDTDTGEWVRWFNGGLIHAGPCEALDGSAPKFTVSLSKPTNEHTWSVHT